MPPTPEQLVRLLEGTSSEQEEALLRNWLAEDEANLGIWKNYQQLWHRYGESAALLLRQNPPHTALAWQRLQKDMGTTAAAQPTSRLVFYIRAMAAALVLLIATGSWWFWEQQQEYEVVAAGSLLTHRLPDGSIATLRSGSRLRYGREFNEHHRKVHLIGEAFFEVQRNEKLAFVVEADAGQVQVLGTSFLVEAASKDSLLLTVYTGVTALYGAHSLQQGIKVLANQSAVSTPQGLAMRHFRAGRIAWKTGELKHHAAPLIKVLSDLEHWYAVPIRCENSELFQCPITIAIGDEEAQVTLAAIAAIFDMELEDQGSSGFVLKAGRCNQLFNSPQISIE